MTDTFNGLLGPRALAQMLRELADLYRRDQELILARLHEDRATELEAQAALKGEDASVTPELRKAYEFYSENYRGPRPGEDTKS